jgi:hypothetical protein
MFDAGGKVDGRAESLVGEMQILPRVPIWFGGADRSS